MDAMAISVVAWQSYGQDGSGYGIYAQCYTAAGAAVGDEFSRQTLTTDDQRSPSVAMDADGDFVVAWTSSGQDDRVPVSMPSATPPPGPPSVTNFASIRTRPASNRSPSVAMDADGDFVVT